MYVIFEGIDTCGKSTQIKRLCEANEHFLQTKHSTESVSAFFRYAFSDNSHRFLLIGVVFSYE